MLGRTFESPNAIDAGDAPPTHPGRRVRGRRGGGPNSNTNNIHKKGTRSPRTVAVRERLVSDERLFRGTRIKIEGDNDDDNDNNNNDSSGSISNFGDDDEEAPSPILLRRMKNRNKKKRRMRTAATTNNGSAEEEYDAYISDEDDQELELYDGDEEEGLSSASEARKYAASVLTESFRYNNANNIDSDEEAATHDNVRLLSYSTKSASSSDNNDNSKSPMNGWRRPSRRKQQQPATAAVLPSVADSVVSGVSATSEEARRSAKYLCTTIGCSILLLVTAIAFVIVVSMAAAKGGGSSSVASTSIDSNVDSAVNNAEISTEDGSSARFLKAVDWLSLHGISDKTALTTPGSPQYQAVVWMSNVDVLQEDVPVTVPSDENTDMHAPAMDAFNNNTMEPVTGEQQEAAHYRHVMYERFLQRYILAVLYYSMGGESWTNNLEFLTPSHECGWFRAERGSDNHEYAIGVTCNSKLLVQDIFIVNQNLVGSIPTELQFLQHLELLSLRHNEVSGTIPTELSHLSSTLAYLDLSKNFLTGTVTPSLGSLKHLRALGLASNEFMGSLPADLRHLTQLSTLDLEDNSLNGTVHMILGSMTELQYLYLSSNEFGDVLGDSFLPNLQLLKELSMNSNQFKSNSELPMNLLAHPHLRLLDMSDNLLQASFPPTMSASATNIPLTYLDISQNQLRSSVPLMIQSLRNLEFLNLSNNGLEGSIPVSLGNMKSLTHIHLGENNFASGPIPPTLFTISNLKELSLPNTQLTGAIPQWVSIMSQLKYVDFSNNTLTSAIPDSVWGMTALKTLLLSGNLFESTLPDVFPQSQLKILALDNNAAITGNASGICVSAENLTTFAYGCSQVTCTGPCCHTECCGTDGGTAANADQCFSNLLTASLLLQDEEEQHGFQVDRINYAFDPNMIRHYSV